MKNDRHIAYEFARRHGFSGAVYLGKWLDYKLFVADTSIRFATPEETESIIRHRRYNWHCLLVIMTKVVGGKSWQCEAENLRAASFAKSVLRQPVWPIIRNILLPSRHKNTDMGAPSFKNWLSINLLCSHNAPKSASLVRFGWLGSIAGEAVWRECRSMQNLNKVTAKPCTTNYIE